MSVPVSIGPRLVRGVLRSVLAAFAASVLLAGPALAQTPPYGVTAQSPTSVAVFPGETVTPVVRVADGAGNGVPGWTVDWTSTGGGIAATTTTDGSGVTSNSFTPSAPGSYTLGASAFDGMVIILGGGDARAVPAGTAGPVNFTVSAEQLGLSVVSPAGGTIALKTGVKVTLEVRWGGATLPKAGQDISWTFESLPGNYPEITNVTGPTDANGRSSLDFLAYNAGTYVLRATADAACTSCSATSQLITIDVTQPTSNLAITAASATPDPVGAGQDITFSYTGINNGPDPTPSAVLAANMPADTTFVSVTAPAGWTCYTPAVGTNGTWECHNPSLANGEGVTVTAVLKVTSAAPGGTTLTQTASLFPGFGVGVDPDPSDNNASASVTVAATASMSVVKAFTQFDGGLDNNPGVNDFMFYTVTATNTGNTVLTNVTLTDPQLTFQQTTCPSVAVGATCALDGYHNITSADIANGVTNTASADSDQTAPQASNTVFTAIPASTLLTFGFPLADPVDVDGSGTINPGDLVRVAVDPYNAGTTTLTGVSVAAPGVTVTTLNCNATLQPGEGCTLIGDYTITQADATAGVVTLPFSATSNETGPINGSNGVGPITSAPALTITEASTGYDDLDASGTITEGDVVHFHVGAQNTGAATQTGVTIAEPGLAPSSATCASLAAGQSCGLDGSHTVTPAESVAGTFSNTATVDSAAGVTYPGPTVVTAVANNHAMTVAKSMTSYDDNDGDGQPSVDDVLHYSVVATNTGDTTLTNVAITDPLVFVPPTTCAAVVPGADCQLAAFYTVTAADAVAGSVTNTASATATQIPTPVPSNTVVTTGIVGDPAMQMASSIDGTTDVNGNGELDLGDIVAATFTVSNTGNVPLSTVQFTVSPSFSGNSNGCASVAVGAPCAVSGTHTIDAADVAAGQVMLTANATSDQGATAQATASISPVVSHPAQALTKTLVGNDDNDRSGDVSVGDTLHYTLVALNTGDIALQNVIIDDPKLSPAQVGCGFVAVGNSCTLAGAYTVTLADADAGEVVNTGSATSSSTPRIPSNTLRTPVIAVATVSVSKALTGNADEDGSGAVSAGDTLQYGVVALNTGSRTLTNLVVSDARLSPSSSACASVAPGGSCPLVGTYRVTSADAIAGVVVNTGSAVSDQIPTATDSNTVSTLVAKLPPTLTLVSGNGASGRAGDVATLVVELLDPSGNPMAGEPINWTGADAPTSVTGADGRATNTVTFDGTSATLDVVAAYLPPELEVHFTLRSISSAIALNSGDGQSGATGTTLPQPLVVVATDDGVPASGIAIAWTVVSGDATVNPSGPATDASGLAGASVTFGNTAGAVQVEARRTDTGQVALFNVSALARSLVAVSGDGQSAPAGAALPAPFVVEAQLGGVAEPGVALAWAVTSGDATLAVLVDPTDALGQGKAQLTCGATGSSIVATATRVDDGAAVASFTATCTLVRTLAVAGGDAQTAEAGVAFALPLDVFAADNGAAADAVDIDFVVTSGDAVLAAATVATDANGRAAVTVTAGAIPGPVVVTASRRDEPAVTAIFNLTVAARPTLAIVSGDGQSGLTLTDADAPLVAVMRDYAGNPVANEAVAWSISGAATLVGQQATTDANGEVRTGLRFGASSGAASITLSSPRASNTVVFQATALDAALGVASGDGQSGPINTTLPLPLTVRVNAPVALAAKSGRVHAQSLAGVPVTFTVATGGGSVAPMTVLTDASGEASTVFTLGPVEGVQSVTATVPGGASVTFTATATVTRTLAIVSGNAQSGAPGMALPNPLVVRAQDNGSDAPGETINWSVVAGSATVTPNGVTDASGLADAGVVLGATLGELTIRAERADDPTVFVTFDVAAAKLQLIPGLSPEQLEIAIVIDDACVALAGQASLTPAQQDFLARCQELISASILDPGATTDALQALLPGLALAMQEAAFNAAQAQFQNLKARIAALRSGTQGTSFQGLALTNSSGTLALDGLAKAFGKEDGEGPPTGAAGGDFQRWGFFASGTIGRGEAEVGSTRPAYDYDINGLTVGLDYRYSDSFIFGGALGYTRQDMELRGQPGTMDMSGYSVSGYATWYRDNSWYSDAVVTWGRNRFDLLRSVHYSVPTPGGGVSTIDQSARSDSDGDMLEGAVTFGRDFQSGGWSIGPYGRVLYTRLDFDRIVDEMDAGAGSGLGLAIDERSLTSVASEIGAKFTYAHSTDWGVVTPHLQVEWEHEFKDDPKALTARFLADPNGTPFSLSGEEIDTDYFKLSLGVSLVLKRGRSGFVIYERTVGRDGFFQDNLGLGVRIEF